VAVARQRDEYGLSPSFSAFFTDGPEKNKKNKRGSGFFPIFSAGVGPLGSWRRHREEEGEGGKKGKKDHLPAPFPCCFFPADLMSRGGKGKGGERRARLSVVDSPLRQPSVRDRGKEKGGGKEREPF